jgi:hypothetical protein
VSQSASQAAAFYGDAAKSKTVWTLRDDGGYPAPMNRQGVRAQPFWSSRSRVEKIVATVPAYAGFEVVEVALQTFLDEWLPAFEADELRVGVNWSGARATGYDIEPSSIRTALDAALEHLASGNT